MSELTANSTSTPVKDENENKDTPTKRTPSKRRSHIERIQEESKELLKNMGVEDLPDARSTRRSMRSSTKGPTPVPVTPPTPKRQPATPSSSSSRGKKKKAQDEEPEEEDIVMTVLPKQTPPRKRQRLSDTIKAEELKSNSERVESKAEEKVDIVDAAQSQEANGSIDTTMEVDEEKVGGETPRQAEGKSEAEGKPAAVVETIPEETSQEIEAESETAKPVPEEKPLQAETKSEEVSLVKEAPENVDEPVELMEVDSSESAAKTVAEEAVSAKAKKESPPEIVVTGAPEPEVASIASDLLTGSVERSVTSSSAKSEITPEVESSVQEPEVSSDEANSVNETKATAEQTQVFKASSENSSQASEDTSAVAVVPEVEAIETLTTESITEQSKIESTQDEPISAPIETETAQ